MSYQSPEHREDPGSPEYEQPTQSLGVIGLHHLNDPQQGLDPGPPQVTHVETLQVHQAGPAAAGEETRDAAVTGGKEEPAQQRGEKNAICAPDGSAEDPGVLLAAPQSLLVDGQHLSQQPLLPQRSHQTLGVHLAQTQDVEGAAVCPAQKKG